MFSYFKEKNIYRRPNYIKNNLIVCPVIVHESSNSLFAINSNGKKSFSDNFPFQNLYKSAPRFITESPVVRKYWHAIPTSLSYSVPKVISIYEFPIIVVLTVTIETHNVIK